MKLVNLARLRILLFVSPILANFYACNYSFTGSSVPQHLSTVAIPVFIDRSSSGESDLSERFTNELILKFTNDNSLQVTDKTNADALLECTILPIKSAPAVVASGEDVKQMRITLTVKVVYKDLVERKQIFDKNFSNFSDYDSGDSAGILEAKSAAIDDAIDKLTEDILLGVVSNW